MYKNKIKMKINKYYAMYDILIKPKLNVIEYFYQ